MRNLLMRWVGAFALAAATFTTSVQAVAQTTPALTGNEVIRVIDRGTTRSVLVSQIGGSPTTNTLLASGIAWLGDSRINSQYNDGIVSKRNANFASFINIAQAASGNRFRTVYNAAIAGARSDQYLTSTTIAGAVASKARYVGIFGAVNDFAQGRTAVQTFGSIKDACEQVITAGQTCILFTEPGAANFSVALTGVRNDFNAMITQYAAIRPGVLVFDYASLVLDTANTASTPVFKAGMSYDSIHLSKIGAYTVGAGTNGFASFMSFLLPPRPQASFDPTSTYGIGTAEQLTNPYFMTTTGGTTGGGSVTSGTVPSGWETVRGGSAAAALTTGASPDGYGNEVVANISFTAAGELWRLRQYVATPANLIPGDRIEGRVTLAVEAGSSNLRACYLQIESLTDGTSPGTPVNFYFLQPTPSGSDSATNAPTTAYTLDLRTDPLTIPSTSTSGIVDRVGFTVRCEAGGSGSAVVHIRRASLRKLLVLP